MCFVKASFNSSMSKFNIVNEFVKKKIQTEEPVLFRSCSGKEIPRFPSPLPGIRMDFGRPNFSHQKNQRHLHIPF